MRKSFSRKRITRHNRVGKGLRFEIWGWEQKSPEQGVAIGSKKSWVCEANNTSEGKSMGRKKERNPSSRSQQPLSTCMQQRLNSFRPPMGPTRPHGNG